jgi:HNH endonuclease
MINFCILCLKDNITLTEEHIFPYSAGGRIKEYILCDRFNSKDSCNTKVGRYIDIPYLNQKHVKLARSVYQIPGRSGGIPIPFDEAYSVDGVNGSFKVKFDDNFQPVPVPQAPSIHLNEAGELEFSLSRDIKYANDFPKIIRTTILRFFSKGEGKESGWSDEQQEKAISELIENAQKTQAREEKIQIEMNGVWQIAPQRSYAMLTKVIYEICCIESEGIFCNTPSGQKIRHFLNERLTDENTTDFDLRETILEINIGINLPDDFLMRIEKLFSKELRCYHWALVGVNYVVSGVFGFYACFNHSDFVSIKRNSAKVFYLNKIDGSEHGVYSLEEFIANPGYFY